LTNRAERFILIAIKKAVTKKKLFSAAKERGAPG